MKRALFALFPLALIAACDGQRAPSGLEEPVRVKGAQLIDGALPGTPPGTPGAPDLRVTSITATSRVVLPGQSGKRLEGRASARASAIGIRFADLGSGYWVFPLGAPDPQFPGELSWEADLDFSLASSDAPGFHPLRVVAIDPSGAAGEQGEVSMCIASRIPDDLSSCDPQKPPPAAVVTLTWDADVDLDLRVTLPGGRTVDPKHPLTDPDAGAAADGAITRDSLAACVKDGRRQEDLVFHTRPKGTIDLYAQLFDPCGRTATSFTLVVYEAEGGHLVEKQRFAGRASAALSGNESTEPPTYVGSYVFP